MMTFRLLEWLLNRHDHLTDGDDHDGLMMLVLYTASESFQLKNGEPPVKHEEAQGA